MKKIINIIAILCLCSAMAFAQNTTKMGAEHRINFGFAAGYSQTILWNGDLMMDINAANSNFRTRVSLGIESVTTGFSPQICADAQYLIPLSGSDLFFYPSVGLRLDSYCEAFRLGPQAALGLEYQMTDKFGVFAEGRYNYMFLNSGSSRAGGVIGFKVAF